MPTNQLRRMLPPVFDAAGGAGAGFIDGLRTQLGGKRCPDDATFSTALAAEALYATAEKNARLRLILERLERSFGHKEPVVLLGAQIEHVMSQTLTSEWVRELGEGSEEEWSQLLHTLGNLTLTKYNADMSNKPYKDKKEAFAVSHFVLNTYFADIERWTPDAIRERGRKLAQLAIAIWHDVGRVPSADETKKKPSPLPVKIRFRSTEEPVVNWKDGFIKLLKQFDAAGPGLLQNIAMEHSLEAVISVDQDRFRRSKAKIGEVYVNTHAAPLSFKIGAERLRRLERLTPRNTSSLCLRIRQNQLKPKDGSGNCARSGEGARNRFHL